MADEETQRLLFSADPVGDWTQYKLEISLDDQYVYVYELNAQGEYEQIDAFICSTGLGDSTPRGIFTRRSRWTAGTISRSLSAGRSMPTRSRATSCSTPCSTASATRVRCA